MGRVGFRGLGLILAAAVTLAGCRGDAPSRADAEGKGLIESPRGPVQVMLRERAERLLAGDVEGYLAGLGPQARAFEEPIARTAVTLSLDKIDMTVGEATISDDGTRFRNALVILKVSFKELPPDNPFRVRFFYDIDRQQDGSFLVTGSAFAPPTQYPLPPLWATGPVELTRSEHFLVMARPGARVAEATERAEEGLARLLPKLTLEADDRHLFVLARDAEEYRLIAGEGRVGTVAYSSVFYLRVKSGVFRPEERYMGADLETLSQTGQVRLERSSELFPVSVVLQHELAHLALSRFTRLCTTPWVVEGAATLLAEEDRAAEWKLLVAGAELDTLLLNPPPPQRLDLAFTNAAVLYLVETHGAGKFFDFYQNFKNLPEPLGLCTGRVEDVRSELDERLLRRYYRLTVEELEGFTRQYIRKAVATP